MTDESVPPTIGDTEPATAPPGSRASVPGYALGSVIGVGGMGEVVVGHDEDIGRDVAVKRMHGSDPVLTARFLREARIQARLEHPAIVPVYEIGHDSTGRPYFAMKRLGGTTFAEIIATHPPRQKLLRAFLDICRAVSFAHSRGVVHRDLKPANIAAGDHGEIYVLDWGLAKIAGEEEVVATGTQSPEGMTQADTMLGTPGYLPPEQIRDARSVGPAADVYALGSILFEILADEPVHPRGTAALKSTEAGVDGSPARRKPDVAVPPELDAACAAALATDPAARPSAIELGDKVERYLDGDRDLERRRALVAEHVAAASTALDADHRAEAARAASRALALDPESTQAAAIMNRLLFELPSELPPALEAKLAVSARAATRRQSRFAMTTYGAILLFLGVAALDGVTNWGWWTAIVVVVAVLFAASFRLSSRAASAREMWMMAIGNAIAGAMGSRAFGPLILIPTVLAIQVLSFTQYPQLLHRARLLIALFIASWAVPIVLEWTDVLPRTWSVGGGAIVSTSNMLRLGGTGTVGLLVALHVAMIIVTGLFASALAVSRAGALRETEIREWHLRQLLPPD